MYNDELITPLNTDNITDETDIDEKFNVQSDECLVDGVTVKDGVIYFGSSSEKIEDAPIEVLDLSARGYNILRRSGLNFENGLSIVVMISDVLSIPKHQLVTMRNMGSKTANEIIEKLQAYVLAHCSGGNFEVVADRFTIAPMYDFVEGKIINLETKKFVRDVPVSSLELSVRARNSLIGGGVNYLSELMKLTERNLCTFSSMGKKTFTEIIEFVPKYLDEHQVDEVFTEIESPRLSGIIRLSALPEATEVPTLANDYAVSEGVIVHRGTHKVVQDASISVLNLKYRSHNQLVINGIELISSLVVMTFEDLKGIKNLGLLSYNEIQEKLVAYLDKEHEESVATATFDVSVSSSDVFNTFREHEFEKLTVELICEFMPEADAEDLTAIVNRLVEEGKIVECDGVYSIAHPSFIEIISNIESNYSVYNLDEREADILKLRSEDATLEEIGNKYELGRERVRQIEKRLFEKITQRGHILFDEDRFAHLFTTYLVDKAFIIDYLKESYALWYYLNMRYSGGKTDIEKALEDKNISTQQRRAVDRFVHRKCIDIDGVYVQAQRGEIEDYILEKYCHDDISLDEFFELYNNFLKENNITDEKLQWSEAVRGTRSNRLADSTKLLWKQNQRLRYYDVEGCDSEELLETLNLSQYENIELSTRKFMIDYPELMERYDIRDEYELHNLLKKLKVDKDIPGMKFGRMPHIMFGEFDRDAFVKKMLFANAPISAEDLANKISDELGLRSDTLLGWLFDSISEYYKDGIFSIDYEEMPESHMEALKAVLTDDFYFITEVEKVYRSTVSDAVISLLNSYNFKRMGFVVASTYVVQHYPTADAFFESLLTSADIVDGAPISKRYTTVGAYSMCLARLKEDLEIVEFEPYQYINIRRLEKMGISKEKLYNYRDCAWSFLSSDDFFSVKSLIQDGFDHELHSLGFMDLFYATILKSDNRFTWQRVGNAVIFNPRREQFSVHDFLVSYVESVKSINIDEMVSELNDRYGIEFDRWDIMSKVKGSAVYYDSIMETLYADYETYYEEI